MKKFVSTIIYIEIILMLLAYLICGDNSEQSRIILAHCTGIITVAILALTLYKIIKNKSYNLLRNKYMVLAYLNGVFGISFMIISYLLYLIERFCPYTHAVSSLNFDVATITCSLSMLFFNIGVFDYFNKLDKKI
jgi:hypothetical protein